MQTAWNPIFNYKLSVGINSQLIYDEIFKAALAYRYGRLIVPIDSERLTNAIFGLNDHDKLRVAEKQISGQKLKELFITNIFLRNLENKFPLQTSFFLVIPFKESSCDTAIMVVEPHVQAQPIDEKQLRLPQEHLPFRFQVKEYVDFKRLKSESLLTPKAIDVEKLESTVRGYEELVIVFLRDFSNYYSEELEDFFQQHENVYLISVYDELKYNPVGADKDDWISVQIDRTKHNYIITTPFNRFSPVSFNRPKFLVELTGIQ